MSVYNISSKATLFLRAYWDIWTAERIWFGDPNIAVWQCVLAVEKTMKGFLDCNNVHYENVHELPELLENLEILHKPSDEFETSVIYLSRYKSGLRYKNMKDDPAPEDARQAISHAKRVMDEIKNIPNVSQFLNEAHEVHIKSLKANSTKYSDVDISKDKPDS
jgi:HEPN domain-containing protein